MRAMTCRQLGGPCGIELRGDTADDVIKLQDRHLPVRSMGWYRATKKAFADLSPA